MPLVSPHIYVFPYCHWQKLIEVLQAQCSQSLQSASWLGMFNSGGIYPLLLLSIQCWSKLKSCRQTDLELKKEGKKKNPFTKTSIKQQTRKIRKKRRDTGKWHVPINIWAVFLLPRTSASLNNMVYFMQIINIGQNFKDIWVHIVFMLFNWAHPTPNVHTPIWHSSTLFSIVELKMIKIAPTKIIELCCKLKFWIRVFFG